MTAERTLCYDLLLRGGHVIDPANEVNGVMDVAIKGESIVCVAKGIPRDQAHKVVDVKGLYVTPGLVDLHVHVGGPLAVSLRPDAIPLRTGCTTIVDAGSAGSDNFEQFRAEVIERSRIRVLALINIAKCGMLGRFEQGSNQWDVVAAADVIERYPEMIVGIKSAHYMGAGFESIDAAVHVARLSRTRIMVDSFVKPTSTYEDMLLRHLRPGDMHTHFYARQFPLLDGEGRVRDYVWKARERGVLFDVGHGWGSFWFRIAIPAVRQGFVPDSISSDLHGRSVLLANATMPIVMSKFLNMGMTLEAVVKCVTVNPARQIGRPELGTLSAGGCADVAVLELREGEFGFVDCGWARMEGRYKLECQMTIRKGQILWDPNGLSMPNWEIAGEYYRIGEDIPRHDWPI